MSQVVKKSSDNEFCDNFHHVSVKILMVQRQISKTCYFEKYYSCAKACRVSALYGTELLGKTNSTFYVPNGICIIYIMITILRCS